MVEIVIPIVAIVIMSLIGFAVTQAMGRLGDKVAVLFDKINAVDLRVTGMGDSIGEEIDEVCGDLQNHKLRDHIDSNAVLTIRVEAIESEVKSLRKFTHWVSDCLHSLFAHATHRIPERRE